MEKRENWSSKIGFILAAAGSAVGLGNIWKFPYIAGENGGGAFILIYLVAILIVGLPVMLCEIILGRKTQKNPVGAFNAIRPGSPWMFAGAIGVLAGFLILSYYSVVAGWTLGYIFKAITGQISSFQNIEMAKQSFDTFIQSAKWSVLCHFIIMAITTYIVYNGIKKGIERWSSILMPLVFVILIILIFKGLSMKGSKAGVNFLFSFDFKKLTPGAFVTAMGHAFFSLSLGLGVMITYGSYLSKGENLFKSTLAIVSLDTAVALLAGLAIFPAVFAVGLEPDAGPGLIFHLLPLVFSKMAFGIVWATLFFILIFFAAITSTISLLEVVSAYFIDELKWSRKTVVIVFGFIIFLLGIPSALSFGKWESVKLIGLSFFDFVDTLSANYFLPIGGILISLFVGWIWGTKNAVDEIRHGSHNFADVHLISLLAGLKDDPSHNSEVHVVTLASLWGIFIRFIAPIAIMIAFLVLIGVIKI